MACRALLRIHRFTVRDICTGYVWRCGRAAAKRTMPRACGKYENDNDQTEPYEPEAQRHLAANLPKEAFLPGWRTSVGVPTRKIYIRFAAQADIQRLLSDGVITGPQPKRETWPQRIMKWLSEQQAGRRVMLIAEDATGLLGMVQLVFAFPPGYNDPEAANGMDVAMMEGLRTRSDAPPEVGTQLVTEVQRMAGKRNVKTLTFCLPMNSNRALNQAKSWGFEEFRIMPEPDKMLAFFRKSVD